MAAFKRARRYKSHSHKAKISEPIIREALKTGKGSDRTIGAINNYYVQKRKRQADKLKDMSERLLQLWRSGQ